MIYHEQSDDYRPLFWLGGRPIYAHVLVIILHVAAFVFTALSLSALPGIVNDMMLVPERVWHGEVWRLVTYVVFPPSILFIFAMGFLFFAGREVEQLVGRKTFLQLYAALIVIPAVALCLAGWLGTMQPLMGGYESVFGVFVALATIYPGMAICIWYTNLTAKGWAWILLGVYSLIDLAYHFWSALLVLWVCAAVGFLGMRLVGAGRGLEWFTDWLEERRARRLAQERNFKVLEHRKEEESLDSILEKISKHGVASLNDRERASLERARTQLIKRDER